MPSPVLRIRLVSRSKPEERVEFDIYFWRKDRWDLETVLDLDIGEYQVLGAAILLGRDQMRGVLEVETDDSENQYVHTGRHVDGGGAP